MMGPVIDRRARAAVRSLRGRIRTALPASRRREQSSEEEIIARELHDNVSLMSPADRAIVERALPYTLTGVPRLLALIDAVRYCVTRPIPGAFVECGVWRGGSVLAMVLQLRELRVTDRDLYLYDTFEGMTAPTEVDTSAFEQPALEKWRWAEDEGLPPWGELLADDFNEHAVRSLLVSAGYPATRMRLVKGPVEQTLPAGAPGDIALLRLDTDWYESTLHELQHLYPRLSPGGVLIVDDYGHWEGCRRAVDEYFSSHAPPLLFSRIDYTARMAVKH